MASKLKLSDQIRQAVAESGVSLRQISKATAIDKAALSRFASGKRGLSIENLDELAAYLGISINVKGPKK